MGLGCSVLGGFVAASLAKQLRILNGILAAWLCLGIGVYTLFSGGCDNSIPMHLGLITVTPLCDAAGAMLRMKPGAVDRWSDICEGKAGVAET